MGLCATHYAVFKRHIGTGITCAVDNCSNARYSNGYCNKHYLQVSIKGKTETTKMDKRPSIIEGDIAKIPLGINAKDGYTLVDEGSSWVDRYQWYLHHTGYAYAYVEGKETSLHRLLVKTKKGMQVDHINQDKLDNRLSNLRVCSQTENRRNRPMTRRNTTGYKGVVESYGKYAAKLGYMGKKLHLGYYVTAEEAARAYNKKAQELHGEFASINKIKEKI